MSVTPLQDEYDVEVGCCCLPGVLTVPAARAGLVLFAHGSGSSRFSVRNRHVAEQLQQAGMATLLFDLLLPSEEKNRQNVFDVQLLAGRLSDALQWAREQHEIQGLTIGLFGASTGAAAALVAAAQQPELVSAVVSRGGRPDLAGQYLRGVRAPTLLIVGERDYSVLELNQLAIEQLYCDKQLQIVPHATHLFTEPGTLDVVASLAAAWFVQYLSKRVV